MVRGKFVVERSFRIVTAGRVQKPESHPYRLRPLVFDFRRLGIECGYPGLDLGKPIEDQCMDVDCVHADRIICRGDLIDQGLKFSAVFHRVILL